MTVQAFLLLDEADRIAARALNGKDAAVRPQLVDNPSADPAYVGKYVLPARILDDPEYEDWHEMLSALPVFTLDSDDIFAPTVLE